MVGQKSMYGYTMDEEINPKVKEVDPEHGHIKLGSIDEKPGKDKSGEEMTCTDPRLHRGC